MNFQQLRIVREAVRQNFNLTEVAAVLFTSQSGVSKHIRDLEIELGVELFVRKGKRLLGLTEPGQEVAVIVERMLVDAGNLKRLAAQFSESGAGSLTVATTHTQARYALPPVVARFKAAYPKVQLTLAQASPTEIAAMLISGDADIGVATEALVDMPDLETRPFHTWHHAVITPAGHPLEGTVPLTLEAIAAYPVVTYHAGFTGRGRVDETFLAADLHPEIVMTAMDADVIKTYVQLGLGIGIIASIAFNAERDAPLRGLDASHLFAPSTSHIAVRRGRYLRGYAHDFIDLCVAGKTETGLPAMAC